MVYPFARNQAMRSAALAGASGTPSREAEFWPDCLFRTAPGRPSSSDSRTIPTAGRKRAPRETPARLPAAPAADSRLGRRIAARQSLRRFPEVPPERFGGLAGLQVRGGA